MARLKWGALDERFYETGVDRGVLYVNGLDGVPWSGLISVTESPTGGEARPAYIDGKKFRNIASSEEFEATIEAFSAPAEFGPCDGTTSIQKGLFATQQPRRSFNFSYRTRIGNGIEGSDFGYKIHLIYNALAAPAERSNTTMSDSAEATSRSWSLTTRPPTISGLKPTAHLVIDTREAPYDALVVTENLLYGTEANASRIPSQQELMDIFAAADPQFMSAPIDAGTPSSSAPSSYDGGSPSDISNSTLDGGTP